jgi:hypothetical protein
MATARNQGVGTGASNTSALAVAGVTSFPSFTGATEEWNFGVYSYTAAAWASGGALPTAKYAGVGSGTQTAALFYSGGPPPQGTNTTLSYNGSAWTSLPATMNTSRRYAAGNGTQTASLAFGGDQDPPSASNASESYNGTSWTTTPSLNTGRYGLMSAKSGTQTAALAFAGDIDTPTGDQTATESWNGSSWTNVSSLNTARRAGGGAGTQTAALCYSGTVRPGSSPVVATESWNGTSWTTVPGGNVNTFASGFASFGTQGAAFKAGGNPLTGATESWNGTAWSNLPSMTTARYNVVGAGIQTAGLAIGGDAGAGFLTNTEEWTGEVATANSKTLTTS